MSKKTWLITGASSGFGRQLAGEVLKRGDAVIGTGRSEEGLAALTAEHPSVTTVKADISTAEGVAAIAAAVHDADGIDVLVNNAGYGVFGSVEQVPEEIVRAVFETHVFAPLSLVRATLPYLRARRGRIINLSSELGAYAWPGSGVYSASKSALELISEALTLELAPTGVTATAIQPGTYGTGFVANAVVELPNEVYAPTVGAVLGKVSQLKPEELGDPRDVVEAILHVADVEEPPVRLAVGQEALTTIRDSIERQLVELDRAADFTESLQKKQ
ncbi:SDR family NAD(P)-dependent oxidoreductase [Streptomyces graminifolii]|uniref:SDR family NAD(P)-dependent oxidoreductase n=1 Tax=Streptomyces graminifolii TaxID=1266771 RepID=UPI004058FA59